MAWWRRQQLEEQLEKELRFHLDQHATELIEHGSDPSDARRQAKLALGGPEQVKEQCREARGTRWLEDLFQDTRYALRALRQKPGFAIIILCTLALGIGAATVMFTIVNGVLLRPLPYPQPDRLVAVHEQTEKYGDQWGVSYPNFRDTKRESRSLAMAAWGYMGGGTLSGSAGESEYLNGRQISSELFSVLDVTLLQGRAFLPEEDRPGAAPVAIVSERLWRRRYGASPAAIGVRFDFDGKPYTLVGVAPASLQLDGTDVDVYTPLGQNAEVRMRNREAHFIRVFGRLRPGVRMAEVKVDLSRIGRQLAEQYPQSNAGRSFLAQPLGKDAVGDVSSTLWLLLGAVSLVLLIGCVNVASLLLARALSRERELAMRVALGARQGRLVRQCLTESAVLGLAGGVLGVALAALGTRPFLVLWPGSLPRAEEIQIDWRVLLFATAVSLASGLLFGLAPALRAPGRGIRTAAAPGNSRRLHGGFVVSEVALAVVLLVSAGTLGRTLLRLTSLDPGVNARNVLVSRMALPPAAQATPSQIRAAWQAALDHARQVPGVQSAALADIIPMRVGENGLGYWTSPVPPPVSQLPVALASSVTPDYLEVMGIPLRQGRFVGDRDRLSSELVVVIDEVLARHAFGGSDPVGKRLWVQGVGPTTVVGVVGHVRHWGLGSDDGAQVRDQLYYPLAQVPDQILRLFSSLMSLTVRSNVPPLSVLEALRREERGPGSDATLYDVRTMDQLVSDSLVRQRFLLLLFGIFAGLALLLACIGIYGVLAYVTSQRVPEIGVRMALGASATTVMRLVLRQSLGMIAAGLGVGLVAATAAGRLLQRLVDGVQPADAATFATMISVLVAAALLASFIPARRASRVDPMTALRHG